MCFMLYAGITKPLRRKDWAKDAHDLCVKPLDEHDAAILTYFSSPEVQYIGSTSGCGCDFPHVTLARGEWVGYPEVEVDDLEWEANERTNRELLMTLLRESDEKIIELYGIWRSGDGYLYKPVNVREEIPLTRILEPTFRFKERGFYHVSL
jgi:hypothetical protein